MNTSEMNIVVQNHARCTTMSDLVKGTAPDGAIIRQNGSRRFAHPYGAAIEAQKAMNEAYQDGSNASQSGVIGLAAAIANSGCFDLAVSAEEHPLNSEGVVNLKYRKELARRDGWKEVPDALLVLWMNGIRVGVFNPEMGGYVPCVQIKGQIPVPWFENGHFQDPTTYLQTDPRAQERMLAYIDANPALGGMQAMQQFAAQFPALTAEQLAAFDGELYE